MASPITSLAPARGREAGDVEGRHGDDAERPSARGPGGAEPDASTAELLHARGGGHQQSSSTWAAVAPCGAGRGRIRIGGGIRVGDSRGWRSRSRGWQWPTLPTSLEPRPPLQTCLPLARQLALLGTAEIR